MKFSTTLVVIGVLLIVTGITIAIISYIGWRCTYNLAKYYENASQNPALLWLGQGYNETMHLWFNNRLNCLMDIVHTSILMTIMGIVLIAVEYLIGKRLKKDIKHK